MLYNPESNMADMNLDFLISAVDKASAVINGVKKNVDDMAEGVKKSSQSLSDWATNNEKTFKKMAVAGGVVATAFLALGKTSFDAFAEAEADMAIANTSLKNSLSGLNTDQLKVAT